MKYINNIKRGRFIKRPNRFIAHIEIDNKIEICHVKNTGRCKELLIPEKSIVYVEEGSNPKRKTKYSLIAVEKGSRIVNMDSQVTNKAVYEFVEQGKLFKNITYLKAEKTYKNSRFDLYVETAEGRKIFIEVKGVTLEDNGVVRFPDAPSERAVKHVNELCKSIKNGYEAYIIFVIQMKDVLYFEPNYDTHREFGEALAEADKKGVNILAYDCIVTPDSIVINDKVKINI